VTRVVLPLAVVFGLSVPAPAQTAEMIREGGGIRLPSDVKTVEYDVRPLLYKPGSVRAGFDSIEQVVREVMANVGPGTWNKYGHEIADKNGTHLAVRTTDARQGEIDSLLKVLVARTDLAVNVSGVVYELDRKRYETELLPQLDKLLIQKQPAFTELKAEQRKPAAGRPVEVSDEWVKVVEKHGQKVLDGNLRIANGRAGTLVSLRKAVEFLGAPGKHMPGEAYDVEFVGTSITATVQVPRERRSVSVNFVETHREFIEVVKGRRNDELRGVVSLVESPRVSEVVTKADVREVPDGAAVLLSVSGGEKDKVRVLIVRPVIFIQAEEDAIKKDQEEKNRKK
jgi:hypothetical protein